MTLIRRVILDPEMAATLEADAAPAVEAPAVVAILKRRGLGDLVERVAHPIGCWLDRRTARLGGKMAWAKTRLCGCSACSRRRRLLNDLVPDARHWKGGWKVLCTRVATAVPRGFLALIDRMF